MCVTFLRQLGHVLRKHNQRKREQERTIEVAPVGCSIGRCPNQTQYPRRKNLYFFPAALLPLLLLFKPQVITGLLFFITSIPHYCKCIHPHPRPPPRLSLTFVLFCPPFSHSSTPLKIPKSSTPLPSMLLFS